jgi:hypothetical protein
LVDDDGHITGIIDWDSCISVPKCIEYTGMPNFLYCDLLPGYSIARCPHMTWAFEHYRSVYVVAMEECVGEDAKFLRKSAVYQAVLAALEKECDCRGVVELLMKEMSGSRRVDVGDFWGRVGYEWPDAERKFRGEIGELLGLE